MSENMREIHCKITGRVQLVMFRDFVRRKAKVLGLVGQVRNLENGSVEVVAQGERETLERLIAHLHKGSVLSRVENVKTEWTDAIETFDDFSIVV